MKINVRGDKLVVTDAIKSYFEDKIKKIEKYYEDPEKIDVKAIIKVKGIEQKVEVTVNTKSFTLRAEESHSDMYAAIDLVIDKLEGQIRKNKNKIKTKMNKEKITEFSYFEVEEELPETEIKRRKHIELKPMSEEEAILQMELIGHDFFVFKNIETESICVLYKRKDANYGIIDTK